MKTFQSLRNQSLLARILFWTGEIIGIVFIIPLLFFVGANIVEELAGGLVQVKEEYTVFIFLLLLLGIAIGLVIFWFRSRTGALITIASALAAFLWWSFFDKSLTLWLLPSILSGALLMVYSLIQQTKHEK